MTPWWWRGVSPWCTRPTFPAVDTLVSGYRLHPQPRAFRAVLRTPSRPGFDQWPQIREPVDNGVGHSGIERRDVAVRDEHGAHACALGAVHVVVGPVANEYTGSRVAHADCRHHGLARLPMPLGPIDPPALDPPLPMIQHS